MSEFTGGNFSPSKVIYPDGSFREYEYNSLGLLIRSVDETGAEAISIRDDLGRLEAIRDDQGNETSLGYTGNLKTSETNAEGATILFEYDDVGSYPRSFYTIKKKW